MHQPDIDGERLVGGGVKPVPPFDWFGSVPQQPLINAWGEY